MKNIKKNTSHLANKKAGDQVKSDEVNELLPLREQVLDSKYKKSAADLVQDQDAAVAQTPTAPDSAVAVEKSPELLVAQSDGAGSASSFDKDVPSLDMALEVSPATLQLAQLNAALPESAGVTAAGVGVALPAAADLGIATGVYVAAGVVGVGGIAAAALSSHGSSPSPTPTPTGVAFTSFWDFNTRAPLTTHAALVPVNHSIVGGTTVDISIGGVGEVNTGFNRNNAPWNNFANIDAVPYLYNLYFTSSLQTTIDGSGYQVNLPGVTGVGATNQGANVAASAVASTGQSHLIWLDTLAIEASAIPGNVHTSFNANLHLIAHADNGGEIGRASCRERVYVLV